MSHTLLESDVPPVGSGFASVQDLNSVTNVRSLEHWHSSSSEKRKQRRPGPANPKYAIPRSEWPTIFQRHKQGESYRQIAQSYTNQGHNVSYQSIYRIIRSLRKQQRGGNA